MQQVPNLLLSLLLLLEHLLLLLLLEHLLLLLLERLLLLVLSKRRCNSARVSVGATLSLTVATVAIHEQLQMAWNLLLEHFLLLFLCHCRRDSVRGKLGDISLTLVIIAIEIIGLQVTVKQRSRWGLWRNFLLID